MTFTEHFNQLYPYIKTFVYFSFPIREDILSNKIIGWNCGSGSVLRKNSCLERVAHFIKELDLPIKIIDSENTNHFQLIMKNG